VERDRRAWSSVEQVDTVEASCLLCGRLNRPHYGSCPSVRPGRAPNSRTNGGEKPKLAWTFHPGEVRVAFELNSEIPRKFLECHIRRLHGGLDHLNSMISTNAPVLRRDWFGHFWLATIWPTCLNQFLDNFEEMFFAQTDRLSQSCKGPVEVASQD